MIILSHRGYWKNTSEKNQLSAFKRSFSLGFGTETDIRDYKSKLVISHDIANQNSLDIVQFFDLYKQHNSSLPLALNIKSDGLQIELLKLLKQYHIQNYFVFDMSVPDGLGYINQNIKTFTRESEYEISPSFYKESKGIWLDEFHTHWINQTTIEKHLKNDKLVCIVSPDLHKRNYKKEWQHYKEIENNLEINSLMLCTDYPEEAKEFFHA